jgi:hypothetical protein
MGLMNSRFSHIVRLSVISVLLAGMLAHLIVPLSSQAQKAAFAQWLNQNVVATGDETENKLRDAIRKLPEQTSDFWVLVEQASQLVASHKDEFHLQANRPITESDQVTSWLVGQWNVFQHQQNGSDAILPETPVPVQKWMTSNSFPKSVAASAERILSHPVTVSQFISLPSAIRSMLSPLVSGISINAP